VGRGVRRADGEEMRHEFRAPLCDAVYCETAPRQDCQA
jgi:hypothetical protein